MKVFVIVDCCSGEDYSTDDPTVLYVTADKQKAIDFFANEISNWEDGLEDYDAGAVSYNGCTVYECTDFEGDSHRILKIVEKEVE